MTWRGHAVIGGVLTFGLVADQSIITSFNDGVLVLAVGTVAALLPDIDSEGAYLPEKVWSNGTPITSRKVFKKGSFAQALVGTVEMVVRGVLALLIKPIAYFARHRGVTHYPLTLFVIVTILLVAVDWLGVSPLYVYAFAVGYVSHIFADATTKSGVALLAPISYQSLYLLPKSLRICTAKGMSVGELVIVSTVVLAVVVSLLW